MWWGEPWPSDKLRADVCSDDALRVRVPVGYVCMHCTELIEEYDRGVSFPGYIGLGEDGQPVAVPESLQAHAECQLRHVRGCSASLRGEGHDHSGSYREDARKVWALTMGAPRKWGG